MPEVLFSVDQSKSFFDQEVPPHNRWHPDVPPVASVRPDATFRMECREWFDGTVHNDDSANDIRDLDLSIVHPLSGPISVEGAQPGDLLVVDILELGPVPQETGPVAGQGWGYTGIFAKVNGGGFLTDHFPDAYKAVWDFHGQIATSRHLPGVRFTGITHPGLIGTAPSHDLLAEWNRREAELIATDPERVPPLALPPDPQGAILGTLEGGEQAGAVPEHQRNDVELELIEEPRRQVLIDDIGAAPEHDVLTIRGLLRPLQRTLDPVGDEVISRPALHRDRLARVMGDDENVVVVRAKRPSHAVARHPRRAGSRRSGSGRPRIRLPRARCDT